MKAVLKGFSVFFAVLIVLLMLFSLCIRPGYLALRYNPDATVKTDYIELDDLKKDRWTSVTQTSYDNGNIESETRFEKYLVNSYSISHSQFGDMNTQWILTGDTSGYNHYDYAEGYDPAKEKVDDEFSEFLYIRCERTLNGAGDVDSVLTISGQAWGADNELLNFIRIQYGEDGKVEKQTQYLLDNTVVGYRLYDYDANGNLIKTEDYDDNSVLIGYNEYEHGNRVMINREYNIDGAVVGYTETQYDLFGRIANRVAYNENDEIKSNECYNYNPFEVYNSIIGYIALAIMVLLSATIGIGVYDDRAFKRKHTSEQA